MKASILLLGLVGFLAYPEIAGGQTLSPEAERKEYVDKVKTIIWGARIGAYPLIGLPDPHEFSDLASARGFIETRYRPAFLDDADVNQLEENQTWWVSSLQTDRSADMFVFAHNHTQQNLKGLIFELADEGCEKRATTAKTFYVLRLPDDAPIEPRTPVLLKHNPTLPRSNGIVMRKGMVCGTIVGAWYGEAQES